MLFIVFTKAIKIQINSKLEHFVILFLNNLGFDGFFLKEVFTLSILLIEMNWKTKKLTNSSKDVGLNLGEYVGRIQNFNFEDAEIYMA